MPDRETASAPPPLVVRTSTRVPRRRPRAARRRGPLTARASGSACALAGDCATWRSPLVVGPPLPIPVRPGCVLVAALAQAPSWTVPRAGPHAWCGSDSLPPPRHGPWSRARLATAPSTLGSPCSNLLSPRMLRSGRVLWPAPSYGRSSWGSMSRSTSLFASLAARMAVDSSARRSAPYAWPWKPRLPHTPLPPPRCVPSRSWLPSRKTWRR